MQLVSIQMPNITHYAVGLYKCVTLQIMQLVSIQMPKITHYVVGFETNA